MKRQKTSNTLYAYSWCIICISICVYFWRAGYESACVSIWSPGVAPYGWWHICEPTQGRFIAGELLRPNARYVITGSCQRLVVSLTVRQLSRHITSHLDCNGKCPLPTYAVWSFSARCVSYTCLYREVKVKLSRNRHAGATAAFTRRK